MALTGNTIIQSVSYDVRQVLGTAGTAQTLLMDYVDRVQKDILHNSFYRTLAQAVTTVTTVPGTGNYTLSGTSPPIRRFMFVYDRTRDRILLPFRVLVMPEPSVSEPTNADSTQRGQNPPEQALTPLDIKRLKTQTSQPDYYRVASGVLYLIPTPQQILTIECHYTQQIATVTDPTVSLTIPDDARDIAVAGVNLYACLFLSRVEEAKIWLQLYEKLKAGEQIS